MDESSFYQTSTTTYDIISSNDTETFGNNTNASVLLNQLITGRSSNRSGSWPARYEELYFTLSAAIVLFNAIALVVFLTIKDMKISPYFKMLLISQTVTDLLVGIFLALYTHGLTSLPDAFVSPTETFLCKYWYSGLPLRAAIFVSTYNLVAISVIKCWSVVDPLFDRKYPNITRVIYAVIALICIAGIAFYSGLFEVASGVKGTRCYWFKEWKRGPTWYFFSYGFYILVYLLPIVLHVVCYALIFYTLCKKPSEAIRTHTKATANLRNMDWQQNLKLSLGITVAFLFCFLFNTKFYNSLLHYFLGYPLNFRSWYYHAAKMLLYANSLVNPVIYFIVNKEYREQLLKLVGLDCILRKQRRQNDSQVQTESTVNV